MAHKPAPLLLLIVTVADTSKSRCRRGQRLVSSQPDQDLIGPATILRQPMVDEAHMEGVYNVQLTFASDRCPNTPRAADTGPSIYTALEKQLGLKREPRKVPVDILVVDHCEKMPTEN